MTLDTNISKPFVSTGERREVAIEQIRGDPERFREVEPGVRSCRVPKFPYSILYGRDDQGLFVLALKHDRRDPDYWRYRVP